MSAEIELEPASRRTCAEITRNHTVCKDASLAELRKCAEEKGIKFLNNTTKAQLAEKICPPPETGITKMTDSKISDYLGKGNNSKRDINAFKYYNQFNISMLYDVYKTLLEKVYNQTLTDKKIIAILEGVKVKADDKKQVLLKLFVRISAIMRINLDSRGKAAGIKNFVEYIPMQDRKVHLDGGEIELEADDEDVLLPAPPASAREAPRAAPPVSVRGAPRGDAPRGASPQEASPERDPEEKCGKFEQKTILRDLQKGEKGEKNKEGQKQTLAGNFMKIIKHQQAFAKTNNNPQLKSLLDTVTVLPKEITTAKVAANYICELMEAADCDKKNACKNKKQACFVPYNKCVRDFGESISIKGIKFLGSKAALDKVRAELASPVADEIEDIDDDIEDIDDDIDDIEEIVDDEPISSPKKKTCDIDNDYQCDEQGFACNVQKNVCVSSAGHSTDTSLGGRKLIGNPDAIAAVKALLINAKKYCDVSNYNCDFDKNEMCDLGTNKCIPSRKKEVGEGAFQNPTLKYRFIGTENAITQAKEILRAAAANKKGGAREGGVFPLETRGKTPPPRPPPIPPRPPRPAPAPSTKASDDEEITPRTAQLIVRARAVGVPEAQIKQYEKNKGHLQRLIEEKNVQIDGDRTTTANVDALLSKLSDSGKLTDETRAKVTSKILQCLGVA